MSSVSAPCCQRISVQISFPKLYRQISANDNVFKDLGSKNLQRPALWEITKGKRIKETKLKKRVGVYVLLAMGKDKLILRIPQVVRLRQIGAQP